MTGIFIYYYINGRSNMARRWPKGEVPNGTAERIKLAVTRAMTMPLSTDERRVVEEIVKEWTRLNMMALALGVHLTKHDYREYMLRKIGVKG
jgi:hypothetical protein